MPILAKINALKRGIEISSAKTLLNWLRKWAMRAVANDKNFQPFYCRPVNHKIKKSQIFT